MLGGSRFIKAYTDVGMTVLETLYAVLWNSDK